MQEARTARITHAFESGKGSASHARSIAAEFLGRLPGQRGASVPRHVVESTELVVSELVTNACKYAPGPIVLELHVEGGLLEVTVRDSEPSTPTVRAADPDRIGRHGLEIVMAVAESFEARREPIGKRVTARIVLDAADPARTSGG
ncbi:ATP-binding protein [Streptomyces bikiniensis]|uniref:ATP-binding protein n=1 Tax=Streptomyces bikiniensis TaxID=1896 RepID=UPI0005247BC1|nr:ATP-binding protein [Streptomyces bikiniensis]